MKNDFRIIIFIISTYCLETSDQSMVMKVFCINFFYISGSSAYNPVERRISPLSKDTSGVILLFDTYGTHLDASSKTIEMELEIKYFKATGEILAEIWSE